MALKVASFPMTGGLCQDRMAVGVSPDVWTDGSNIDFREGLAHRAKGMTNIGGNCNICSPRHLLAWNGGENYLLGNAASELIYAGTPYAGAILKIGRAQTSTATHADGTPAAWVAGPAVVGQWTGGITRGSPYLSHPGYPPVHLYGGGGALFITMPDWVATFGAGVGAIAMRHYLEFYVALGLRTGTPLYDPDVVNWSARGAGLVPPAAWNPLPTNAAGNAYLPGGGTLVDAAPLGQALMIYKQRSIWAMRYVGGNYIFDIKQVVGGIGALSQNCIAVVGNTHYILTQDDFMSWNGTGDPVSVIDGKVKTALLGQITDDNYANCFVTYLPRQREVWACYAGGGGTYPNRAVVLDLSTGYCGIRSFENLTHAAYQRELTATLTGKIGDTVFAYHDSAASPNGRFGQVETADTQLGSGAVTTSLSREQLDLGAPAVKKKVRWLRPWVDTGGGSPTVSCSVAATDTPDATPNFTSVKTFTPGTTDKIPVMADGRYISVRFTTAAGNGWTISGFDLGYELGGQE